MLMWDPVVVVKPGDTALFRCAGSQDETSWFRGTEVLRDGGNIKISDKRFTFRDDADDEQLMALSDTVFGDSNSYVCRSNTGDREPLVAYTLVVSEPPAIRVTNGSFSGPLVEVNETGNVSLWCNVTGVPLPRISWYAYLNKTNPIEIGINGPKLQIRNISRYCPWRYYCEMEFAQYEDMTSKKEMNLTINYSPSVVLQISKRSTDEIDWHYIELNETENSFATNITDRISLHCLVDARPYNSSTWLFNGTPFVTHSRVDSKPNIGFQVPFTYEITEFNIAVQEHYKLLMVVFKFQTIRAYGEFECQAQNALGMQSASFSIREP
ncbi:IgLON family member 5 [Mizuhopecten yessoensis]|uniref:IgLON family member 5 n=1 Tax=Mizuhopecten yessoensis TaxID=6573 RepID=A0A210QZE9_MIZYE|nr:IgLON family member 5 [Mizuhopecten yessoensis]